MIRSQVIAWRVFYSFGMGYILYKQSEDNKFVMQYLKRGATKFEAFDNWKRFELFLSFLNRWKERASNDQIIVCSASVTLVSS